LTRCYRARRPTSYAGCDDRSWLRGPSPEDAGGKPNSGRRRGILRTASTTPKLSVKVRTISTSASMPAARRAFCSYLELA
jgi:hypothetical protein